MNEDDLRNLDPSELTPQKILEFMNTNESFFVGNPYEIVKKINNFNRTTNNPLSAINDEIMDLVGSGDYIDPFNNSNYNETVYDGPNLNDVLDEIIEKNNDIFSIEFNSDQENIYEIENPTVEKIDLYKDSIDIKEEDIPFQIKNKNKKNGSIKQKTITVVEFYGQNQLVFKDDAEDLFVALRGKLLTYWNVIVNFDSAQVSEVFLRYSIGRLCKWLTPKEILERVEIVNIDDNLYLNFVNEILPNSFKHFVNLRGGNEQNTDFEKQELLDELNKDNKIFFDSLTVKENISDAVIPFVKIKANYLGKKREKKLKYPVYFVEMVTQEVINKYDIDNKVETYVEQLYGNDINWDEVVENIKYNGNHPNYKYQLDPEKFEHLFLFVQSILIDSCYHYLENLKNEINSLKKEMGEIKSHLPEKFLTKAGGFQNIYLNDSDIKKLPDYFRLKIRRLEDLEFSLMDKEHKYFVKEDILKNVFEIVGFSMYTTGLDKVRLISFHYLTKYLEKQCEPVYETLPKKIIRGYRIPLELLRFDLVRVLCHEDTLRKFVFTLKELISKWVFKYSKETIMAKYYYDIFMITPETIEESVLRYIVITAVKNKNPMTLRAVYSSYISLIHNSIFMTFNSDFLDRKYGFFSNLNTYGEKTPHKYLTNTKNDTRSMDYFIKTILDKFPKNYNENYYLLNRLDIYPILEVDSLRIHSTKPDGISIDDWWYLYVRFFKHIDKENLKIKAKFIKSDKRNNQNNYIDIIVNEFLYQPIFNRLKDDDCTKEILRVISEDISIKTINRGYLNNDFKLEVKSNTEYLDEIYNSIIKIRDNLNGNLKDTK